MNMNMHSPLDRDSITRIRGSINSNGETFMGTNFLRQDSNNHEFLKKN